MKKLCPWNWEIENGEELDAHRIFIMRKLLGPVFSVDEGLCVDNVILREKTSPSCQAVAVEPQYT